MPTTRPPDAGYAALPAHVQIEPVGRCNLRCAMCLIRFRVSPGPGRDAFMRHDVFRRLIDQFSAGAELHLQGLGEPLLHPDFFDMVAYAARRGMRVSTNSNLTRLDPPGADECVRSGLSWMRVSIDGAHRETYESIRTGARFETVLRNLELLTAAKERLGSGAPRLFLVMVAMRRNIHELPDIVRLARRHSLEQVFVQHLCCDVPAGSSADLPVSDFIEQESLLFAEPGMVRNIFAEARALASELDIELRLPGAGVRGHPAATPGRKRCDWPWRAAYISFDGLAMPCCMVALPERINFGSMVREGVAAVWNSAEFREFRSALDSGDPPPVCRTCSVYNGTF